jgi:hypothetical protein
MRGHVLFSSLRPEPVAVGANKFALSDFSFDQQYFVRAADKIGDAKCFFSMEMVEVHTDRREYASTVCTWCFFFDRIDERSCDGTALSACYGSCGFRT